MIKVPLTYKLLFGETDIFSKIENNRQPETKKRILFISSLNYQVSKRRSQSEILRSLLDTWGDSLKETINFGLILANRKTEGEIEVFSEWVLTEYIKTLILNHDKNYGANTKNIDYIDEFIMFVDYLKFAGELINSKKHSKIINAENGFIDFYRTSYPNLLKQYTFSHHVDPLYQISYAFAFLQSMKEPFDKEISVYLSYYNASSNWNLSNFFTDVASKFIKSNRKFELPIIKIEDNTAIIKAYEDRIINCSEESYEEYQNRRFLLLKKFPLYRIDEKHVCMTSWRFLMSSIGEVIAYDFYEKSGVKNKINKFLNFKSAYISSKFAEKFFFKNIMSSIFYKKYCTLIFDEDSKSPDCYYRIRNKIYIIEFKDLSFSDEVISSSTLEEMTKYLELRLVENDKGRSRGIGQIVKHIDYLKTKVFKFDNFIEKKCKRSKIEIFPLIIYSNMMFSFPLANQIVKDAQRELLTETLPFKRIHDPVMIPLQALFGHMDVFSMNPLHKILKLYFSFKNKHEKILNKKSHTNVDQYIRSKMMRNATLENSGVLGSMKLNRNQFRRKKLFNNFLTSIGAPII